MKLPVLYSIRDVQTSTFTPPFVCKNDAGAFRQLEHFRSTVPPSCDPADFVLYRLACWDDDTGILNNVETVKVQEVYLGS